MPALKRLLIFILMMVLTIQIPFLNAAELPGDEGQEKDPARDPFFKALLKDEGEIWTSPFRFSAGDWLLVAGLSAVTGYLIANDESLYGRIKAYQGDHPWVDDVSPTLTLIGDGNLGLGVSGLFFLTGAVLKDRKARDTSKLILMSLIHSGIVVQMLKHLTGRQRPEAENGVDRWEGPAGFFKRYKDNRDMFYDAFPSGHTITAWSTATVIAHQYNKTPIVPVVCYGLAALSGLSRVTEDKHWVSDVFAGAVLGFAIGKFIYSKRSEKFIITPIAEKGRTGISLGIRLR